MQQTNKGLVLDLGIKCLRDWNGTVPDLIDQEKKEPTYND